MDTINEKQEVLHHELSEEVRQYRQAEHEIDPVFLNRWSPRAFSEEPVDDEVLMSAFEAARWAPSSNNEQPWRFIIARTPQDRQRFLEFLVPANQVWAKHAPVLLVIISKKTFSRGGAPNTVYQFDAGCAWGYIALQALQNGLITHGMAGFENDKAREILGVPEDFDIMAVIAIGKRGYKSELPEKLQEREIPSGRRPLSETIMEGGFRKDS
jgi:nitroreductase